MTTQPFQFTEDGEIAIADSVKVLKKNDYLRLISAQEVMAELETRRHDLEEQAKQEHEEARERGYREGLAQASAETSERLLKEALAYKKFCRAIEEQLAEISHAIVKKILGETESRSLILGITKKALQASSRDSHLILRVAPEHRSWLRDQVSELLKEFPEIEQLDIQAEQGLAATSMIIETPTGAIIDASLEVQLNALRRVLKDAFPAALADCKVTQDE